MPRRQQSTFTRLHKWLIVAGTVAGALIAIITLWSTLGWPIPATRGYVDERLRPIIYQQIKINRHVHAVDLFQWQQNKSLSVADQEHVNHLREEIARLSRQISDIENGNVR